MGGGFDFIGKIRNKIQELWGNPANAVEPLQVTARTPTAEEQMANTQDQGTYFQGDSPPVAQPQQTQEPVQQTQQPEQLGLIGNILMQLLQSGRNPSAEQMSQDRGITYPPATEEGIVKGLTDWGGGTAPPIATQAAALAILGNLLNKQNPNIDPNFPAALSLKETGGGKNIEPGLPGQNNGFGVMSFDQAGNRSLANYPDFATSTLGGGTGGVDGAPQQGLKGTLMGGNYDQFLKSGDYADFFPSYSPPGENSSVEDQIKTLQMLLQFFGR